MRIFKACMAAMTLLFAAGVGGAARAEGASACNFHTIAELPLKFVHNRPLVETEVNGRQAWFLMDTGAAVSLIHPEGVLYLGLSTSPADGVTLGGVGGAQAARMVVLHELKMGGYTAPNMPFLVAGRNIGGKIDKDDPGIVVGLFGRDLFGQVDFEFDLAASKLRMFKPVGCNGKWLGYWSGSASVAPLYRGGELQDAFRLPVTINGRTVNAILDSGATSSVINPSTAQRVGAVLLTDADAKPAMARGLGPRLTEMREAKVDGLTVGDEQVKNATLSVSRLFEDFRDDLQGGSHVLTNYDDPDMLLGADFLRAHRVLVSTTQNKIYFSYTGGPIFTVRGPAPLKTSAEPDDHGAPSPAPRIKP